MTIKLAWTPGPAHFRVIVFVGADGDHLARAGELTLTPDEAHRFRMTVRMGVMEPGFTGIFESGWLDNAERYSQAVVDYNAPVVS